VPWQLLASAPARGSLSSRSTVTAVCFDLGRLDEFLTSDVKLLAMTHISNSLGTINPVVEYCERARRRGIVTLIDAAQSAGHRPSTCSRSAAISSRSPATKCAARPASACCTAGANGSKKPRRIRAAAR